MTAARKWGEQACPLDSLLVTMYVTLDWRHRSRRQRAGLCNGSVGMKGTLERCLEVLMRTAEQVEHPDRCIHLGGRNHSFAQPMWFEDRVEWPGARGRAARANNQASRPCLLANINSQLWMGAVGGTWG